MRASISTAPAKRWNQRSLTSGDLADYQREWEIAVSSPGIQRPLRKPSHYRGVVGRRVSVRTEAELAGRKRFKGQVKDADDEAVVVGVEGGEYAIPYDAIVRGNLIDEGN